jgi:RNA polymerase sigma factor (sigma-70 family)
VSPDETPQSPDGLGPEAGGILPPALTVELFEKAVRAHSRRLLAIARAVVGNRASPEDVLQQALANLFQHRERYDWREPGGLMRRSVVNEALRILRQPRMAEVPGDHPGRAPDPDGGLVEGETVLRVREAIDRLPEHFRAALVLCEYEGMAYAQIAETLGASVPQVKTWLHRGRRQLARMLGDYVAGERKSALPPEPLRREGKPFRRSARFSGQERPRE